MGAEWGLERQEAPTQLNRAPAGQPAPNLAFLPAQPGPNPLPSSALQELFQQGGHRKSTQQVPLLADFSCRAWPHGGCSRPAPYTPTPRVHHKFYLMHQSLASS